MSELGQDAARRIVQALSGWCCPAGEALGVAICPECAQASAAYSAAMAPVRSAGALGVCAFCNQPAEGWTQTELTLGKRWHNGAMEFHCRMAAD